MSSAPGDEWLRPIDLAADSDAPEQIDLELGRRHALYLREAQRLTLEGQVPDEAGLADGIRGETCRYLDSHPWLVHTSLDPVVAAAEERALASLRSIVAAAAAAAAPPSPPQVRRLALQPSATFVGNLPLRKRRTPAGVVLEWSRAANVVEWVLRVSVRPDPRGDYEELEEVTLPGTATSFEVELDELPRRIQLLGNGRSGRTTERATVSALTRGNSGAQWKRQGGTR
jgi:hypothetical protein